MANKTDHAAGTHGMSEIKAVAGWHAALVVCRSSGQHTELRGTGHVLAGQPLRTAGASFRPNAAPVVTCAA